MTREAAAGPSVRGRLVIETVGEPIGSCGAEDLAAAGGEEPTIKSGRPGLREALAVCRAGDTLVVTTLDRLARSLPDARAIADELTERQISLALGGSVYDPSDAKAKGRLRGKQPKLNRKQQAHLVSLVHGGEYSTLEVAELLGVGRSTVYRAIARQRLAPPRSISRRRA